MGKILFWQLPPSFHYGETGCRAAEKAAIRCTLISPFMVNHGEPHSKGDGDLFQFNVNFVEALPAGCVVGVRIGHRHPGNIAFQRLEATEEVATPPNAVDTAGDCASLENVPNIGKFESSIGVGRIEASDVGGVNRVYTVGGDVAWVGVEVTEPVVFPVIGQAVAVRVFVTDRIGDFDGIDEEVAGAAFDDFQGLEA